MEMLQVQLNTIENQNVHVPSSSNTRRILAPNTGSSSQESGDSETSQPSENIEMSRDKTNLVENNTNVVLSGASVKPKDKKEATRRSKKKATDEVRYLKGIALELERKPAEYSEW